MSNKKIDELDDYLLEEMCKKKCQFYKEGQENSDKDYRCGAYMVLKCQLENKDITKEKASEVIKKTIKLEYQG